MTTQNIAQLLLNLIPAIYMVVAGHDSDLSKIAALLEDVAAQLRSNALSNKTTNS